MPVAGIMPQSDPNVADAAAECDAVGWWLELAPAAGAAALGDELPQAAAVSVRAPASVPVTMAPFLRLPLLLSVRMGPPCFLAIVFT
jgi:hypothetical protein